MGDARTAIHPHYFSRINTNNMGHPRYVLHHSHLLTEAERVQREAALRQCKLGDFNAALDSFYAIACKRARAIGGRKFDTKSYRMGIVFVSFSLDETIQYIEEALTSAENFQRAKD